MPGDIRVFLLPDRLWSSSRAWDWTSGNCTILLDDERTVSSVLACIIPSPTLQGAPAPNCVGHGHPTGLSRSSSCCLVAVRPSVLARSSRRLLFSTMLTLQHSNPEREEKTERKQKKGHDEKNKLTSPSRLLPSVPVLFSSGRASPVGYFFGYSLHRRSTASHRSTFACWYLTSPSYFLTIIRNFYFLYNTPYPTSCTLHWKPRYFPFFCCSIFLPVTPNTRLPRRQPFSFCG